MSAHSTAKHPPKSTSNPPESFSELSADKRTQRLARNQQIREANKARLVENEKKQRITLTTQVMNPNGNDLSTGERIKAARLALGMSQTEFAKALGMSRKQTISEYEHNKKTPRPYIWGAIAALKAAHG